MDYMDCILEREKVTSLKRRYNTPNLQISFRINWIVMLTVTASILFCQFAESDAKGQASVSVNKIFAITFFKVLFPSNVTFLYFFIYIVNTNISRKACTINFIINTLI